MKRDACLCLTCLSEMSQPKNRAIVTTTCQGCGKELIARAEPGYHYCAVCSTIEQRCMSCGEARSTASEQLAVSLIRKLTEWDATLTWSYEAAGSVLEFEMKHLVGRIYPNEEESSLLLQIAPKLVEEQMNWCLYQKQVVDPVEAIHDLEFMKRHWSDLLFLAKRGHLYQSEFCGYSYSRWYWETYLALVKLK